jgi:hypothetical protein
MPRIFSFGGLVASILLIAIGIGATVIGISGRGEVRDQVKQENIVGTPDMTPSATAAAIKTAKLDVSAPSCTVAGKTVDSGARAKCFAQYMRVHTLEATGGQTYSEMARFLDANGKPTNDDKAAAVDPKSGKPVENGARNIWVTETALSTALNTSFFAQQVALFSIVMGIALLLVGIGFLVLTVGMLRDPKAAAEKARIAVGKVVPA